MKAIIIKIIPCTNTKPTRLKASAEGVPSITVSKDSHTPRQAAELICLKYGWGTDLVEGDLPNGDTVFCFAPARPKPSPYHIGLIVDTVWGRGRTISKEAYQDIVDTGLVNGDTSAYEAALRYIGQWDNFQGVGADEFRGVWSPRATRILNNLKQ